MSRHGRRLLIHLNDSKRPTRHSSPACRRIAGLSVPADRFIRLWLADSPVCPRCLDRLAKRNGGTPHHLLLAE